jgi:hypothetical protein
VLGGVSRNVNYSTMDFTVPIQKDTEREIFDYIDLESLKGSLQRINVKYEEELSDDMLDFENPMDTTFDE